jgi:hypothetical protein
LGDRAEAGVKIRVEGVERLEALKDLLRRLELALAHVVEADLRHLVLGVFVDAL